MTKDKPVSETQKEDIPAFVEEVIRVGSDICAVDHSFYVLRDVEQRDEAQDALEVIGTKQDDQAACRRKSSPIAVRQAAISTLQNPSVIDV